MSSDKSCSGASVYYVRLPASTRERVLELSESEERPFSTTIRRLVEHGLRSYRTRDQQTASDINRDINVSRIEAEFS